MNAKAISLIGALTLAACTTKTQEQVQSAPTSEEGALVASAGINVSEATKQVERQGFDTVTNTGQAVGMAQDFGAAGIGVGALTVLTSPGPTLHTSPKILTTIPPSDNPESKRLAISQAVFRASRMDPISKGYRQIQNPNVPTAVLFIKDGCKMNRRGYYDQSCSLRYSAYVTRPKTTPMGETYRVTYSLPLDVKDYEAFSKRVVDQMPSELSLYIPPKKIKGQMQPAKLYRKGKETVIR